MDQLVSRIRSALREAADPTRAPGMQAYMKSAMPYLGVRVPDVRRITRSLVKERPPADLDQLEEAALELWDGAKFREERYAAASLTGLPMAKGRLSLIPLHEHMAITGAWWDHVDEIAHRIADLHDAHPVETAHDVRIAIPTEAALTLRENETIAKIPGAGKSVTLSTLNRGAGRLSGGFGAVRFDVTVSARTESGETVQQDVFLDLNG